MSPTLRSSSLAESRYSAQSSPRDGMVGVIGWDDDLGRVGLLGSAERPVRLLEVDLGEEGLVVFEVGPIV